MNVNHRNCSDSTQGQRSQKSDVAHSNVQALPHSRPRSRLTSALAAAFFAPAVLLLPASARAASLGSIDFTRYLSGGLSGLSNLAHRGQELGFTGLLPFMDDVQGGFEGHGASSNCALQWIDFACLAIIAGTIVIALRMWHQTHRRRLELAREMVAHGVEPHHGLLGLSAGNDLRRGLVLASAGLGLLAASYWASPHNVSPIGLIPLFIGLGYLASARVAGPGRGASP